MNILTDEEIDKLVQNHRGNHYDQLARAIESAVLSKLEEQSGVEPSCWMTPDGEGWRMRTTEPPVNDVPLGWTAMYQESQLLAAQQRTAEACAKAVERLISGDGLCADDGVWIHDCAEAIRNGDWREYL